MSNKISQDLRGLAQLIRSHILISTTEAGSGHPTSSLSAVELMAALLFGGIFRFDADNPQNPANDRLIFSKGHASPLLYALWAAAGKVSEKELLTLRKFGSKLEGHPRPLFPYAEAATGSLGQGLSIGLGMALASKIEHTGVGAPYSEKHGGPTPVSAPSRVYVLLGDSEIAEGSNWEAMQLAAHYKLDNLIGIIDVNRLGQRGETMYGHNPKEYEKRVSAFGWETITVKDGHSFGEIYKAYERALKTKGKPVMIIAKTIKGKGVSFLEDKDGWHGKALSRDELDKALRELGDIDKNVRGEISKPEKAQTLNSKLETLNNLKTPAYAKASTDAKALADRSAGRQNSKLEYQKGDMVATRKAYGNALVRIFPKYPEIVVLDAEVSNSTHSEIFQKAHPERFFEMFIAEQNMVGAAVGLARRGKLPFVSTFAAFLTRAFDQVRMAQYSDVRIVFCGSHAGVSIGQDGPSQMGLEDIAMFRTILNSAVFYPADAVSCEKLAELAARYNGISYIRTTREKTPVIYDNDDDFVIGGSKVLRSSADDKVTVVAAGITLHEALKAYDILQKEGIALRVIDLYSVKPVDGETLRKAAAETKAIITVEDHFAEGGLGEAVKAVLTEDSPLSADRGLSSDGLSVPVYSLAVRRMPTSGAPEELLDHEGISANAIVQKVKRIL